MPVAESFDGSAASLSNFNTNWSTLGWASGNSPKGQDTATGWRPVDAYPAVNGAFYGKNLIDTGTGVAVVATMAAGPSLEERHFSLWLDAPTPSTSRAGYELKFTYNPSGTYTVALTRWQAGSESVLTSKSGYAFANGNSLALVDQGKAVSAWTNTGSGFSQILTATDATFAEGKAALQGAGNFTRLSKFKAGPLSDQEPPDTLITEGPTGTIGASAPSFSFNATELGSTFECSIDGVTFASCASPKQYVGLANGQHSFRVRATDPAGNTDPTPAERIFRVNTSTNQTSVDPMSLRTSSGVVAAAGAYNYAPSVMLDGNYRAWWCAGIAGDHIAYAESPSMNGPFHARNSGAPYEDVLQPSPGKFDGTHTCDPSVIRVRGTYYMYYGGLLDGSGMPTQIGVAQSASGISWTRMNGGNPIVGPVRPNFQVGEYGAGQPSAAYVDGFFYLMYTDTSGYGGPGQYAMRSSDPTFQTNVEVATASGFVPKTASTVGRYVVSGSYSPDWQYSDALEAWIVLSNQNPGETFVRFLSKDLSHLLRADLSISANWVEGPGLASTPEKHALAPTNAECQRIQLDYLNATVNPPAPNNLKHFGADLQTQLGCSALPAERISAMFNGYGIEVDGLPLTVVVDKQRLQFALAVPAQDITKNFVTTTPEVFSAIPYGASLHSGDPAIGATGRPAAFVLDNSVIWPVSSTKILTDNNSAITSVPTSTYDQYQVGPALFEASPPCLGSSAVVVGACSSRSWYRDGLGGTFTSSLDVSSWGSNRLDVFGRGLENSLWHKYWFGPNWSAWELLGGNLASAPSAVSWGPNRIDVVARATDNSVIHWWWENGWHSDNLGGNIVSDVAISSWGSNRLDVFGRGPENALWHRAWQGGWFPWENLGGNVEGGPGAVSASPGRIDVVARRPDKTIAHWWWSEGWHLDSVPGMTPFDPELSSRGPGQLDLFTTGMDGMLHHASWTSGGWDGFETLWGPLTSGPGAVSWNGSRIDVVGRAGDNSAAHWFWAGP